MKLLKFIALSGLISVVLIGSASAFFPMPTPTGDGGFIIIPMPGDF